MGSNSAIIIPEWPKPDRVRCLITTRIGGVSSSPYDSFNLAEHVDDQPESVTENRGLLEQTLGLPVSWFRQVHSTDIVTVPKAKASQADGVFTCSPMNVCAVLTADCLPILLSSALGDQVAAIHCGWRGLANGMIKNAVAKFTCSPSEIMAYLGPAISQAYFEVGADVLSAFELAQAQRKFATPVEQFFSVSQKAEGKYYADLYGLARSELRGHGLKDIYGGDFCTFSDLRFYSYRRDHQTGRFASLIWIES